MTEVHFTERAGWRAWLAANHAEATEVWLLSWKKATGRPSISYADAVEEARCFGWVDGRPDPVDADRSKRRFGRRLAGSAWSATKRQQAERMIEAGLMTPAGQAAIDQAKADGSRNALDEVEATTLPDDLAAAFAVHPGSQAAFEAYPNYLRRDILEWIAAA